MDEHTDSSALNRPNARHDDDYASRSSTSPMTDFDEVPVDQSTPAMIHHPRLVITAANPHEANSKGAKESASRDAAAFVTRGPPSDASGSYTPHDGENGMEAFGAANMDANDGPSHLKQRPSLKRSISSSRLADTVHKLRRKKMSISAFLTLQGEKTTLCAQCANLNLKFDNFVIPADATMTESSARGPSFHGERRMGTLLKILERTKCQLCDLIVRSLGKDFTTDGNPSCSLVWTEDGMERVPDGQDTFRTVHRTRRLQILWRRSSHKDLWKETYETSYIVLVAPEAKWIDRDTIDRGRSTLFLGRLLTSVTTEDAAKDSIDLAVHWLSVCTESHGHRCNTHPRLQDRSSFELQRSPFFAVVDVNSMCLTTLPRENPLPQYVAMSYTWGPDSEAETRFRCTTKNFFKLQQTGGIADEVQGLPKAVIQAITLTRKLSIKYLWVDSLCIVQDDERSWTNNAAMMDVIYGNATLTICAADNDSAEMGLKALSHNESRYKRQAKEHSFVYQKSPEDEPLRLLLSHPSESYIAGSRWNHRGWTLQERLLSPRCLIFVEGRMYFQCRSTTMSEDIYSDEPIAGWSVELHGSPAFIFEKLKHNPVNVYQELVKKYTSRFLSRENDILDAFKGATELIKDSLGAGCQMIYGLPSSHFDWALLWNSDQPLKRRTDREEPDRETKHFPSWSWCGWKGDHVDDSGWGGGGGTYNAETIVGSDAEFNLHKWLQDHTWITYYISDSTGRLRLLWNPRRDKPNEHLSDWKGYMSPTDWISPCDDTESGKVALKYDMHGRRFDPKLPIHGRVDRAERHFSRRSPISRLQTVVLDPEYDVQAESRRSRTPLYDETYLQFFTWCAKFYITESDEENQFGGNPGPGLKRFGILDVNRSSAGTCVLEESWSSAAKEGRAQEFIALSASRKFAVDEWASKKFYSGPDSHSEWQLYNVMMLEYKKDDRFNIGYRAGLGKVFKTAFSNSLTVSDARLIDVQQMYWKEIVLG